MIKFMITCRICVASPSTAGGVDTKLYLSTAFFEMETSSKCVISLTTCDISSAWMTNRPFPE